MKTVRFEATLQRFGAKGEKTGWTYVEVPPDLAQQLKPGNRREFKVRGKIDRHSISRVSLLPMGGGRFILVLNAPMRKAIGKTKGAQIKLALSVDESPFIFNPDLMACLADDPAAKAFFQSLTGSHQRYFSKWIDDAKTEQTREKRIARAVNALSRKWGYPEMLRNARTI